MRRREFISFVAGAAAFWPAGASGQQTATPVIGILGLTRLATQPLEQRVYIREFQRGLREAGFVEGQNVAIEYPRALDSLQAMADDLVRRQVSVIIATSGPAAHAAKAATTSIPVVFLMNGDPVAAGLVSTFQRPGGNMTGVTMQADDIDPKRLELLCELVPNASKIAAIVHPRYRGREVQESLREAANALQRQLQAILAVTESDFETALSSLGQLSDRALLITPDPGFNGLAYRLGALTLRYRIPAIYQLSAFAAGGGLVSYGYNLERLAHPVGVYVGRILKGESPAGLPVQQPTTAELVINLRTAKALGLAVSPSLLIRADEVIE